MPPVADSLGADPGDRALLEVAVAEGRVVVTIDLVGCPDLGTALLGV